MTLFVDMDEVIADTYGEHIKLYNKNFNANLTKTDCLGYDVWQKVSENHRESIRNHANQIGFFRNLTPIKDSQTVLKELAIKHNVFIASAAMQHPNSLKEKSDWLDEFFPFIPWQNRILCGHKHILRGDILIDDRSRNLKTFEGRSILFTSPHNVNTQDYERVDSWLELRDKLL